MLKENDFRRVALGMTDAIEAAHMGHPDFRANGRIFATLHHDRRTGMVKLTPEQQQRFTRDNPASFTPENGAWGRAGSTRVQLDAVDEDTLGDAMTLAWQNTVQQLKTLKTTTPVKAKAVKTTGVKKRAPARPKAARSAGATRPSRPRRS
jgi:hypothetical protein